MPRGAIDDEASKPSAPARFPFRRGRKRNRRLFGLALVVWASVWIDGGLWLFTSASEKCCGIRAEGFAL